MKLAELIDLLSRPMSYPHPVNDVEVHQTHISVVFLAGPFAYKVKKPVALGFLDFRAPERRRHFCHEEVRLNRRLAPGVYLGVVPVTRSGIGRADQASEAVEWAVQMERLPHEATLSERLRRGELTAETVEELARTVAAFHRDAPVSEAPFEAVAQTIRDNFEEAASLAGVTAPPSVVSRVGRWSEELLEQSRPLLEGRAGRGVTRECHGDLRLEHVYILADGRLAIVDCLEFSQSLRCIDPVADMAFLAMDLKFHGRPDLARRFGDAYFRESGEEEGRRLLPLYTAYRAVVRAKVEGIKQREGEVPEPERAAAAARARAYWLLARGELEPPRRRPGLVLVGGLPGVGKSTLARELARREGFSVIRSDQVRKELAGPTGAVAEFGVGRYAPAWTKRTYDECLRRTEETLRSGGRVIVDASFRDDEFRRTFLDAAERLAVSAVILDCHADPETARARLAARRGDASDADWEVYREMAKRWEPPGPRAREHTRPIDTDGGTDRALAAALSALRDWGLVGPEGGSEDNASLDVSRRRGREPVSPQPAV